jgi:signal transduction histidine kinase
MAQMREANEHLVVAAVRAQTLTEEAETASHLKDEFLTDVSHEIRTPLNAILLWARMLESKQLPPERFEHAIAAIGRNASALAHMVDAIKFTPEGGRVNAFIESANDTVEFRVVDTGRGISPDFLPHAFERFRQGEDATTQRHSGLGLGLGIVRDLVALHRGTVHAASPGVGQGATSTVRLPMADGGARRPDEP